MSDNNNNNNNNNISRKTVKKKQREGGVEPNPKRAQGVLKSPIPEEPDTRGAEGVLLLPRDPYHHQRQEDRSA